MAKRGRKPYHERYPGNPAFAPANVRALQSSYSGMKSRCYSESCSNYDGYGGRGIRVCDQWLTSFPQFVIDMGVRPAGMSLDRIDVDGHYSRENCRWATRLQQASNTREAKRCGIYEGRHQSLSAWARELEWPRAGLFIFLKSGKTLTDAFDINRVATDKRERQYLRCPGLRERDEKAAARNAEIHERCLADRKNRQAEKARRRALRHKNTSTGSHTR